MAYNNDSSLSFIYTIAANESPLNTAISTPAVSTYSYFRSKTFTSFIACNPLIAAANALLACNQSLKKFNSLENLEQLHLDLVHEIKAFESNAKDQGYSAEVIMIARYVLCAAIDESIIYNPQNLSWQAYKLINTFQKGLSADERFFLILQRLLNAPIANIDLLELMYHCLSLGFEGKYRREKNGYLQLQLILENLYQQIRIVRQEPPRLPVNSDPLKSFLPHYNMPTHSASILWSVAIKTFVVTLMGMSLMYGSFVLIYNKFSVNAVSVSYLK